MSDTPRTDAWRETDNGDSALAYDRCEQLERELAAERKAHENTAREMMKNCHESRAMWHGTGCQDCVLNIGIPAMNACPARLALARLSCADAWQTEVTP